MRSRNSIGHAVAFVDRFRWQNGCYPPQVAALAERIGAHGWTTMVASNRPGRISFFVDMLATLLRRRSDYAVACISVFSGPAFVWAEAAASLLRYLNKPFVAVLRGGNLPDFARYRPERVRRLLSSASAVAAPSRYLQEAMLPYRSDVRLLPNAIDLRAYRFRLRATPAPNFVWLRAFESIYNPALALQTLSELIAEYPESVLTMIGPDKGDGSLQAFRVTAKTLQLEKHVEYTGLVRKEEVPARLDQGDIFINTTNVDNTPVSVVEALACGLCVVSTNVGGVPYLLKHGHSALLVPPNDPAAMAGAVRRILSERGLAGSLSRAARKEAEQFDWETVLPQWGELFDEVTRHT